MIDLPNYSFSEVIHESLEKQVLRGRRSQDGTPVVAKLLKSEYPRPRDLARLRHEHAILRSLDVPGVVKSYGVEPCGNGIALILEGLSAKTLHERIRSGRTDLETMLRIALALAEILAGIHEQGVIHKDIKPHNILIEEPSGRVALIDFGIATRLSQEILQAKAPDALEGTLAYMSPEQTGRMNRVVDHRTDLYSLGATIYELLTGTMPFASSDPMELVHSHIARLPLPPHQLRSDIPVLLSQIVMKLLAKGAEDRYQTARGLAADLRACLASWEASRTLPSFTLGQHDLSATLQIPQKLYGREEHLAALLEAFDRVKKGGSELVLVAGTPGIGKTSLVCEMHRPLAQHGGELVTGKFDLLHKTLPFGAITQACRERVRQLLAQPASVLTEWRRKIVEAVGGNGRLLTDLIPDLELVIGPQPAVAELGSTEAQNRFGLVFQNFVSALCGPSHPLVMFIDDLHGADSASLWLLRLLLTDQERGYLMIVASYRSSEVDPAHPLTSTLKALREQGLKPREITLEPLSIKSIQQLLCETLKQEDSPQLAALAQQVATKTHGNPFFISQFLHALAHSKLLRLDSGAGRWVWDSGAIADSPITDNVVEFMADQIEKLGPATRRVIATAACIGNQFDLSMLADILGATTSAVATELWPAVQEGLLIPTSSDYRLFAEQSPSGVAGAQAESDATVSILCRFLHDRVQQAAYSLFAPEQRQEIHLRIGQKLRQGLKTEPRPDELFEVVHHLNAGSARIQTAAERLDLARLDRAAARIAKGATAYATAVKLLSAAVAQLDESIWTTDPELAFSLCRELAEYEYLAGQYEHANARLEVLLGRALTDLQRAEVLELRMMLYTSQGRFPEGMLAGQAALKLLGIELPQTPQQGQEMFFAEVGAIKEKLASQGFASLLEAPRLEVPEQIATLRIMVSLAQPAYQVSPPLGALIVAKQVRFSLTYGHMNLSPYGYVAYGLILAGLLGQYAEAVSLGHLALQLVERLRATDVACKVRFMFGVYAPYAEPLRISLAAFLQAQETGLETGDHVYASLAFSYAPATQLRLGEPLENVRTEIERGLAVMKRTQDLMNVAVHRLLLQVVSCLEGRTAGPTALDGNGFISEEWLAQVDAMGFAAGRCLYHTYRLQLAYLHEDYQTALSMAAGAQAAVASAIGMHWTTDIPFYSGLALAALRYERREDSAAELPEPLALCLATLASLAQACPANDRHRHLLLCAEIERLSGKPQDAHALYEQAIQAARGNGFPHHEALANELYARFHLSQGDARLAAKHLERAVYGYERWGATAKAKQLSQKYGQVLASPPSPVPARNPSSENNETTTTTWMSAQSFDVASALQAAQAISSEIVLHKVLDRVMRIVLASAGAQRGFLLLERDGALFIEALITLDPEHVEVNLHSPLASRSDLAHSVVNYVLRSHESVVLGNASRDTRFASDSYIASAKPKSVLCSALLNQGRLSGLLYLENNITTNTFTQERVELLRLLSTQAAISVENALLYSRQQELTEKLRQANETLEQQVAQRTAQLSKALADLWSEMNLAHKIQTVLLPTDTELPGYEVAAVMRPAANVGGDYYDIFKAAGTDWLLIGDVSGHGVSAGLCMMMVQTAVRSVVHTLQREPAALRPSEVLTLVNAAVHRNLTQIGRDHYMTITAFCFSGDRITYAGVHQDLLIYRAAEQRVERLETSGVWLGLLPSIDSMLQEDVLQLQPGDVLLLFTDGLTEAKVEARRLLLTSGLMKMFQEIAAKSPSPEDIIKELQERIKNYVINDDLTIIAVKRRADGGLL